MKNFIYTLIFLVALASCQDKTSFQVTGHITNAEDKFIYLDKLEMSRSIPLDSIKVDKKGEFVLDGFTSEPTFYLLRFNEFNFITLLVDSGEVININADFANFARSYKVEGSAGSKLVLDLNQHLTNTNHQLDSINLFLSLHANDADYAQHKIDAEKERQKIIADQIEYSKKFVTDNPFSLASVLAIYQKFENDQYVIQDLQTLRIAASALNAIYPNSEHVKALYADTKNIMRNLSQQRFTQMLENNAINSPEIVLPNEDGEDVALTSLRGKHVLVHFWSALNPDSRMINGILKENYKLFKNKGFEIYQVSIDTSRTIWTEAIDKDGLNWINVGDMEGSNQAVINYNVRALPYNYLLNEEGEIIAVNLKGPALYNKLKLVLN